jgi:hypothetical protein
MYGLLSFIYNSCIYANLLTPDYIGNGFSCTQHKSKDGASLIEFLALKQAPLCEINSYDIYITVLLGDAPQILRHLQACLHYSHGTADFRNRNTYLSVI